VSHKAVLSPEQQRERAKSAVADLLCRQLIVPKVFFDAPWPDRSSRVDVLAVDRSGSGEIHVAEVTVGKSQANILNAVSYLMQVPAHFKYLVLFDNQNRQPGMQTLYSTDGMGRIGLIHVQEDHAGNLSAELVVRPERFRLDSSIFKRIDRFTASRPPNLEVRP
jgi:hypothetical protein